LQEERRLLLRTMRYQFTCTLSELRQTPLERLHLLLRASAPAEQTAEQHSAWEETLVVLHEALVETPYEGQLYFEFAIPRLGARIDVVMIIEHVVFVLEFKTGAGNTSVTALDQVTDYALDLRYFHRPSHAAVIAPFLVTESKKTNVTLTRDKHDPRMTSVAVVPPEHLAQAIASVLTMFEGEVVARDAWVEGAYEPTPTIVEAARALYRGHRVEEITRSTAGADNLATTSQTLTAVIHAARERDEKVICFVTGVPGAGKTLVGLNLATAKVDESSSQHCVYLSGNGPLVAVLREALVRDAVEQSKQTKKRRKGEVSHGVKAFIQNVHHFRDDSVRTTVAPTERIVVFDEAQRAWNQHMTTDFMKRKKGVQDFHYSEPEFLISCMDRHSGWAVIVCLVGNGQEINRGEAGITAWLEACATRFTEWHVYASPELGANEEQTQVPIEQLRESGMFMEAPSLHLRASLRSFRSTLVSEFVNSLLSFQPEAGELYQRVSRDFPIVLTRDVSAAKQWVRDQARGSERFGILASSAAQRLRPYAIDVTSKINPVHWFLNGKDDVRSSYFLESVATEFDVQGLELDWTCIAWDADFRFQRKAHAWDQYSFRGSRWERIQQAERRAYHINAYRVLLTRARQGMVIVVPHGAADDHTRQSGFYDDTYGYLKRVGVREV
jgi:hypothetical protein